MHRPTESARAAGLFSKKLRHAGIRARATGQRVGVIAIGGDYVIIRPHGSDRAGHDRFLTDVKMTKAADLLRLILLTGAFFETPDQQHQREHLDFVALLHRLHGIIGQQVYLSCARCNAKRAGLRLLAGASSSAHESGFASDGSVAMNNPAFGRFIYRRNEGAGIARRCVGAGRALT
jgi:hypothetical protein